MANHELFDRTVMEMVNRRGGPTVKRRVRNVQWLDENMIGHSTAYREDGKTYVEVRVFGSVLLNGKEHVVDEVVIVEAEPHRITPED